MKRALIACLLALAATAQAQTFTTPQVNSDWTASNGAALILNKPTLSTVASTGNFADLISKPTTLAGYGITDGMTSSQIAAALALKFNVPTGTTSQYIRGDGSFATLPGATAFNFGAPNVRSLSFSVDYQATDTTKAAVFTISPSCTNATTVLAASACTMQTRIASTAVTCSTGTVVNTWASTYALGLLITNTSGSPFTVNLPIGYHLILCSVNGTFTVTTAVDQSAG